MGRVYQLDELIAHGALKGSIFKMKAMSPARLRGFAAWSVAGASFFNMATLSLMFGPTIPTLGIVASSYYGASSLNMRNTVTKIDYIMEGEHKGLLRITICKTPFSSFTIIVSPQNTMSICSVGGDDVGEEDADANIICVKKFIDESTGKIEEGGFFTVPADAHRDKTTMEWIFAVKEEDSKTDEAFNDQIFNRHMNIAATGGLTGLRKYHAEQTGYANFGMEEEVIQHLKNRPDAAD